MMKLEDTRGIGTSCSAKPTATHPPTHFSSLRSRKGYLQNEVPGHVGAYTQTHTNIQIASPGRARRRRIGETHTRTYVAPKSQYVQCNIRIYGKNLMKKLEDTRQEK